MMLYRKEFPNYDDTLRIPKGFKDCSYHNNICPHVSQIYSRARDGVEVTYYIWQDYVDPERREYPELPRFTLSIEVNGDVVFEYRTDVWEEIEKLIPHLEILNYNGWCKYE